MVERRDSVLTFGLLLAGAGALAAAVGLQMLSGFVAGVIVTLMAAAIAGADFD